MWHWGAWWGKVHGWTGCAFPTFTTACHPPPEVIQLLRKEGIFTGQVLDAWGAIPYGSWLILFSCFWGPSFMTGFRHNSKAAMLHRSREPSLWAPPFCMAGKERGALWWQREQPWRGREGWLEESCWHTAASSDLWQEQLQLRPTAARGDGGAARWPQPWGTRHDSALREGSRAASCSAESLVCSARCFLQKITIFFSFVLLSFFLFFFFPYFFSHPRSPHTPRAQPLLPALSGEVFISVPQREDRLTPPLSAPAPPPIGSSQWDRAPRRSGPVPSPAACCSLKAAEFLFAPFGGCRHHGAAARQPGGVGSCPRHRLRRASAAAAPPLPGGLERGGGRLRRHLPLPGRDGGAGPAELGRPLLGAGPARRPPAAGGRLPAPGARIARAAARAARRFGRALGRAVPQRPGSERGRGGGAVPTAGALPGLGAGAVRRPRAAGRPLRRRPPRRRILREPPRVPREGPARPPGPGQGGPAAGMGPRAGLGPGCAAVGRPGVGEVGSPAERLLLSGGTPLLFQKDAL